jgi:SAM-dependent methyltransferase
MSSRKDAKHRKDAVRRWAFRMSRLVREGIDVPKLLTAPARYSEYFSDLRRYRSMSEGETISFRDAYPKIHEKSSDHPFDSHYFFQDWWAFNKTVHTRPADHVDVASSIDYVSLLSNVVEVTCVDIRPLNVGLPNLACVRGDITALPLATDSVKSLSCLHVVEHIGLGRYGDRLDPAGTRKACKELARVLAPGGKLYLGVPVGRERVCFNSHRVHAPGTIASYMDGLKLVEFSGIGDDGKFHTDISLDSMAACEYGCGLYLFTK